MKKFILFFLIIFLVGCETVVEPKIELDEPVLNSQPIESEPETEVSVDEEKLDDIEEDSLEDDTQKDQEEVTTEEPSNEPSEEPSEEPSSEPDIDEDVNDVPQPYESFEDLFMDAWFSEGKGNYVSFRILGVQDLRLYFKGGHQIRVNVDLNVRDDQPFLIYEAVEAAGQFLNKYPLSFIQSIDQLQIVGTSSSLVQNGSRATIGSNYLLRSYNNLDLIQGFALPLLRDDYNLNSFEPVLWEEITNEIISYERFNELNSNEKLKETYYAYLLKELESLPEEISQDIEPYISAFMDAYVNEATLLISSSLNPQLPNNMPLNIQMNEFYDVIPDNAPTTFLALEYKGETKRYYERLELPPGCYSPPQCPGEVEWDQRYLWNVHQFTASFSDGQDIEFNLPVDTELERAEFVAEEFAIAYGRVNGLLREGLHAVFIIDGRSNVWGGPYHGWGTTLTNCGECDVFRWNKFEELIMHELVHSTIDYRPQWYDHITGEVDRSGQGLITLEDWDEQAVNLDGFKMDQYSRDVPAEDRAQTMLFYAAYRLYPDSISELTKDVLEQIIPNRIKTFDELLGFN